MSEQEMCEVFKRAAKYKKDNLNIQIKLLQNPLKS